MTSLIVDDKHHVIYCYIPKVACTSWKRMLVNLTGRVSTKRISTLPVHQDWFLRSVGLKLLGDYREAEASHRLETYRKYMFVRHPLERILSAYRDKFTKRNKYTIRFHHKYGRNIIRRYRKSPNEWSLRSGSDVTFAEFIKYLGHLRDVRGSFNPHWEPFYRRCDPCNIQYDVIGKLETMVNDVDQVLRDLFGLRHYVSFPHARNGHTNTTVIKDYYGTVSAEDLKKLVGVYAHDFELFGYNSMLPLS